MTSPDAAGDELDPGVVRAVQILRNLALTQAMPDIAGLANARRSADALGAFLSEGEPALAQEADIELDGPHGPLPCRIFATLEDAPALVYFHGGGFALGRADGWNGLMRRIVRATGLTAISVDYRRSPEHPFPVAFEEACFAIDFVQQHSAAFGIDPQRVAAGGDSAGANLALAAACALKQAGNPPLVMLLLFYGVYSLDLDSPSWARLGDGGSGLSRETMAWFWDQYARGEAQREDWRVAPLAASLDGLPYSYLCVGTMDPLLDDNCRLQERLALAKVEHVLRIWPGLNHGFARLDQLVPIASRAVAEAIEAVRARLFLTH